MQFPKELQDQFKEVDKLSAQATADADALSKAQTAHVDATEALAAAKEQAEASKREAQAAADEALRALRTHWLGEGPAEQANPPIGTRAQRMGR